MKPEYPFPYGQNLVPKENNMNKILKAIAFNARVNKLAAKLEAAKAAKEAARKTNNLGRFEAISKKIDSRMMRIERALFKAGKINTLTFQAAV
ncbi:hypothetical protein [Burkholderia phage FLC8]|nr:hypothetical protein [Burkholderia phage FLC8]